MDEDSQSQYNENIANKQKLQQKGSSKGPLSFLHANKEESEEN